MPDYISGAAPLRGSHLIEVLRIVAQGKNIDKLTPNYN
jgi:hypothetical protein